ncbi:MAG TPA: sugar ABC transporter substrate-binding protein [Chloroflexota bacterium]|nr:sugar ABC transporter substrate-binding protein [Chloroflexota bacterium]
MSNEESIDQLPKDHDPGRGFSRRELIRRAALGTTALSIPAVVSALGQNPGTADAAQSLAPLRANPYPGHPRWRFTFVNHVTTNPFFVPTQYGAQDAARLFNCQFQWTGSVSSNVAEMVNAMNTAIAANVDGIAVAIIDPHAFNDPVNRALAKGIPVVAYNADAPASSHNSRLAYIGQDLYLSGFKMGQRIVNLVGRGDVVLFIATPGSLNIQPRINGAAAAIRASGGSVHYQEIASGALVPDELARIEAYYIGHKSIKGMFAVDAGSTQSVGQISQKYHLKGRVKTGGYDLTPVTLNAIASGNLNFTIDQQPYLQGFIPMQQLFLYKLSGGLMFPSDTNTGVKFVTQATVGKYRRTTSRYEGSSPAEKWIH